jgi:hypothetical protein
MIATWSCVESLERVLPASSAFFGGEKRQDQRFPKRTSAGRALHKIRFALLFSFSNFFPLLESLDLLVKPRARLFLNGKLLLQSSYFPLPLA